MIVVHFGDLEEYLDELRSDTAHLAVERRCVRTTKVTKANGVLGRIVRLYVESSYVKAARPIDAIKYEGEEQIVDHGSDAQLVRLTLPVGILGLGRDGEDAELLARADKAIATVDQAVRDLDLDARAGLHEVSNAEG
jgi:hypothetical protein